MKTSTIPMICGVALAAMSAAGFSHWWSVKSFVAVVDAGLPIPASVKPAPEPAAPPAAKPVAPTLAAHTPKAAPAAPDEATQRKFYEALIAKMESIQNQNRDLLDQVAETNRDVMKLEFRVDTHSESFRPMPVNEERLDTSFDDGPGVLPPRADPVFLPTGE
jgi:predicted RNase H-like nuclease (RuvC/YqgF family)